MNIDLNEAILRLDANRNLQLRDAQGGCVHVHWGDLWITQEGDIKDHVVKAGESFAISKSGTTYLAAMHEAGVSVMEKCGVSGTRMLPEASATSSTIAPGKATDKTSAAANATRPGDFQLKRFYPESGQVERYMKEAARLRARHFANMMNRVWNMLQRSASSWRALG